MRTVARAHYLKHHNHSTYDYFTDKIRGPRVPMGVTFKEYTKVATNIFTTSRKGSAAGPKVIPLTGDTAMTKTLEYRLTRRAGPSAMMATTWWGFTEVAVTRSIALRLSSVARCKNVVSVSGFRGLA